MRVAVVGSRSIGCGDSRERAYELLCRHIPVNATEIISGGAVGIDSLAEVYARENGLMMTVFKPDYAKYGKRAPLVRNDQIIAHAQYVIAIWDGESHGTAYTMTTCFKEGIPLKLIRF